MQLKLQYSSNADPKLPRLAGVVDQWFAFVCLYAIAVLAAAVILFLYWDAVASSSKDSILLLGALATAAVALFGNAFVRYAEFAKQYEEKAIDFHEKHETETALRHKRLIAFHAEINENALTLAGSHAPENRKKLIASLAAFPTKNRFGIADKTNPIYDDNKSHLNDFGAETIRAIINYYNLENNLNQLIDSLLLKEFRALETRQKLLWHVYMFELVQHVADSAAIALSAIEKEHHETGGKNDLQTFRSVELPPPSPKPQMRWHTVNPNETEPLLKIIDKLSRRRVAPKTTTTAKTRKKRS